MLPPCITYRITSDKTVEVASGPGSYYQGEIVIPRTVQYNGVDYTVTGIAEKAFTNCIGITSIEIPDTITNIGREAFYGCSSLSDITSNSLNPSKIDSFAFVGCPSTIKIYIPERTKDAYVAAGWPKANLFYI